MTTVELTNKKELDELINNLNDDGRDYLLNKLLEEKNSKMGPYADMFKMSTDAGEESEKFIQECIFSDVTRVKGEGYDLNFSLNGKLKKGESKLIRMIKDKKKWGNGSYIDRAVSILDKEIGYKVYGKKMGYYGGISTKTFQQIKPIKFDWMVGVLLYTNGFDVFLIPTEKFTKSVMVKETGKCYMSGQHDGNSQEGQTNINDKILLQHHICSVFNDGKDLYLIDRKTKEIGEKFNKIRLEDLINEKFNN
jgi:hypothetical protein